MCVHIMLKLNKTKYIQRIINQSINQSGLFRLAKFGLRVLSFSTLTFRYCDTFPLWRFLSMVMPIGDCTWAVQAYILGYMTPTPFVYNLRHLKCWTQPVAWSASATKTTYGRLDIVKRQVVTGPNLNIWVSTNIILYTSYVPDTR